MALQNGQPQTLQDRRKRVYVYQLRAQGAEIHRLEENRREEDSEGQKDSDDVFDIAEEKIAASEKEADCQRDHHEQKGEEGDPEKRQGKLSPEKR
jgi:hypothetical protein